MVSLSLSPTYSLALTLASTQDDCSIEFVPAEGIVLQLAAVFVGGGSGSGVSGPDIYAFAAAHG